MAMEQVIEDDKPIGVDKVRRATAKIEPKPRSAAGINAGVNEVLAGIEKSSAPVNRGASGSWDAPMPSSSQELASPFPGSGPKEVPTTEGLTNIVKGNPEARKRVIQGFAETQGKKLTDKQMSEVDQLLLDDAKLNKKMENSSPGPSALFTTALLGFLPVLVGAAFGGDEGGAIGAKVGLGAIKQVADETEGARKADLEERKFQLDTIQEQGLQESRAAQLEGDLGYKMAQISLEQQRLNLDKIKFSADQTVEGIKRTEGEAKAAKLSDDAEFALFSLEDSIQKSQKGGVDLNNFLTKAGMAFSRFNIREFKSATINPLLRSQLKAGTDFSQAVLRDETGAAMADHEVENKENMLLPQPGDTPDILAQKVFARRITLESLKTKGKKGFGDKELDSLIQRSKVLYTMSLQPALPPREVWDQMSKAEQDTFKLAKRSQR